jgi:hypothetical protein
MECQMGPYGLATIFWPALLTSTCKQEGRQAGRQAAGTQQARRQAGRQAGKQNIPAGYFCGLSFPAFLAPRSINAVYLLPIRALTYKIPRPCFERVSFAVGFLLSQSLVR